MRTALKRHGNVAKRPEKGQAAAVIEICHRPGRRGPVKRISAPGVWLGLPLPLLVILPLTSLVLSSCTGRASRTAPFRARPDAVEAGTLEGPFDGRVVDAATGNPIAGALVYANWSMDAGFGGATAAGYRDYVTSTNAAGHYMIPALRALPALEQNASGSRAPIPEHARLVSFSIVIYKRGFVGYRSDRRFNDLGPRMDFAQKRNRAELERWRDDFSHARHLLYLGGGPALAALTSWEVDAAAAELSAARDPGRIATNFSPGRGIQQIVAAQLLSEDEIKELTDYDGEFETGPLGDDPDTDSYSSQHFKALGRPQTFDIAVRMWQLDPGAAQQRYSALADTLPGVEQRDEIAHRSLRATENDINGVAFLDGQRGVVVLLTCGQSQCANIDMAVSMANIMYDKIKHLLPLRENLR